MLKQRVAKEDITDATVTFTPKSADGNVQYWHYEFHAGGGSIACNSNGNKYNPTGWDMDYDSTVRVNFSSGWEEYEMTPDGSDVAVGSFNYLNSNGLVMDGGYVARKDYFPCQNM